MACAQARVLPVLLLRHRRRLAPRGSRGCPTKPHAERTLPGGRHGAKRLQRSSRMQQYPWEALGGETPMPPGLLERMRKGFWRDAWWSSLWIGWPELHHASKEQGLAERKVMEEALKDKVDRLAFVDEEGVTFSRWEAGGDREMAARYFGPDDGARRRRPGRREHSQRLLEEENSCAGRNGSRPRPLRRDVLRTRRAVRGSARTGRPGDRQRRTGEAPLRVHLDSRRPSPSASST